MEITVYTTSTCPACRQLKEFFKERGTDFNEIDVGSDSVAAEEMVAKSGQMSVPVTVVSEGGEEKMVIGFDRKKFEEIFEASDK